AAGALHHALAHFLNRAIDDMVGAQLPSEASFFFAAHDTDDREACRSRKVNERVSHAARGRIDEYALSGTQPQRIVEDVISDLIIGKRGRGIKVDVVRQRKGRLRGGRDVLRVMSATMRLLACSRSEE